MAQRWLRTSFPFTLSLTRTISTTDPLSTEAAFAYLPRPGLAQSRERGSQVGSGAGGGGGGVTPPEVTVTTVLELVGPWFSTCTCTCSSPVVT
jgi:hypothetical protein